MRETKYWVVLERLRGGAALVLEFALRFFLRSHNLETTSLHTALGTKSAPRSTILVGQVQMLQQRCSLLRLLFFLLKVHLFTVRRFDGE